MRGLAVFSPNPAYSRCVLVVPVFDESCGLASPRSKLSSDAGDIKCLSLLEFDIRQRTEQLANSLTSQFDSFSNYGTFGYQNPFAGQSSDFGPYEDAPTGAGIADFRLWNTCNFELPNNANASAVKWTSCRDADGLVVIGTTGGDVCLLNGHDLVTDAPSCLLDSTIHVCNNPVKRLSYNSKTSTLAVAGLDGQISSIDLASAGESKVVDISFGKWRVGMVTGLSWNNRLGHILATSGSCSMQSGSVSPSDSSGLVVWDLKVRKPASSFRDPNGRLNPVGIEWLPDQLTQLVVGYGDDKSPALQLWDLRNCSVPLKEIKGHTRGVTSLGFSLHDPSLLLTSGRDDFTRCWSMDSVRGPFSCVSSIQTEALSHHKRIEWHPTFPGLFLGQDTDDENLLYQVFDYCATAAPGTNAASQQCDPYLPSWIRPVRGVASGFGGNVYTWNIGGDVKGFNLKADLDANTFDSLEHAYNVLKRLENRNNYAAVCQEHVDASDEASVDALTWKILDATSRGDALAIAQALGYRLHVPASQQGPGAVAGADASGASQANLEGSDAAKSDVDGEEFFNALVAKTSLETASSVGIGVGVGVAVGVGVEVVGATDSSVEKEALASWGDEQQRKDVIAGDFKSAANESLKRGNSAEALLLAYAGGPDLWLQVASEITRASNDPFLKTVFYLMQGDLTSLVRESNLEDWRETLACVCNIYQSTSKSELTTLCNLLADRLYSCYSASSASSAGAAGDSDSESGEKKGWKFLEAAFVTYTCAANAPRILETWRLLQHNSGALDVRAKSLVFCAALNNVLQHPCITEAIGYNATLVAEALVEAGHVNKALDCLTCSFVKTAPAAAALVEKIQSATSTTSVGASATAGAGAGVGVGVGVAKGTVPTPLASRPVTMQQQLQQQLQQQQQQQLQQQQQQVPLVPQVPQQPQVQQTVYRQQKVGQKPPSQVTTAPGAVAGAMYPGMPVPWPLPTETQQRASNTQSTQESNRKIIATAAAAAVVPGEQMPPQDLSFCTQVLSGLVPVGEDTRAAQETRRRVDELVNALSQGQLPREANSLITNMCTALSQGDRVNANIVLSQISTKLWNSQNKGWIMCLKRIVPK